MNKIFFILTLFFVGCNATTNKTNENGSTAAGEKVTAATTEQAAFSVTVTQNGKQVVAFTNDGTWPAAVLYKESFSVYLNDSKNSLTVDVQATKAGNYQIKLPTGSASQKGYASIMLIPDVNEFRYSLNAQAGNVVITQLTNANCSGNFESTGKTPDGKIYTLNGTFKNIPVKQIK